MFTPVLKALSWEVLLAAWIWLKMSKLTAMALVEMIILLIFIASDEVILSLG